MLSTNKTRLVRLAAALALLGTASFGAMAEWTEVNDDTEFTAYIDLSTIRRAGHMVKVWGIRDFKSPGVLRSDAYFSARARYEFDCSDERVRIIDTTVHSGRMGSGLVVATDSRPGDWSSVAPGSIGKRYFKLACGIK